MTPIPSPKPARGLLAASGSLGLAVADLLADAPVDLIIAEPDAVLHYDQADVDRGCNAIALVTDRPYPDVASRLDDLCWGIRVPWLEATIVAHRFRIGPIILPQVTPCRGCWARRVRSQALDPAGHDALEKLSAQDCSERWFTGELKAMIVEVAAIAAAEFLAIAADNYPPPEQGLGRYWDGDAIFGSLIVRSYAGIGRCRRCSPEPAGRGWKRLAEGLGAADEAEIE
jgi:hypothetical protein